MGKKYKVLKTEMGLDDLGMSGIVFETKCLIKDEIYDVDEAKERYSNPPAQPFIVDRTGCIRFINTLIKDGLVEEVK